jgi:hypothetical protein
MSEDRETATRYRQHAEELRVIAVHKTSAEIRGTLLSIADDYDRMAASLEAIEQPARARGKLHNSP